MTLFPIAWVKDFVRVGLDVVETRLPFKIATGVSDMPRSITVSLINTTKDMPLYVHRVAFCYGSPSYNNGFILEPKETVSIAPKSRHIFSLVLPAKPTIYRHTESKDFPLLNPNSIPTFEKPSDLFKAFANGSRRDSWIEIDFNEFRRRRFRKGKVKPLFVGIIKMGPPKVS